MPGVRCLVCPFNARACAALPQAGASALTENHIQAIISLLLTRLPLLESEFAAEIALGEVSEAHLKEYLANIVGER